MSFENKALSYGNKALSYGDKALSYGNEALSYEKACLSAQFDAECGASSYLCLLDVYVAVMILLYDALCK